MKTLVVSIAVNADRRVAEMGRLIATFKEHTDYDFVVYLDKRNQHEYPDYGVPTHYFEDISPESPFKIASSVFNYNLKFIALHHAYNHYRDYDRVIWCDCDVFLKKPSVIIDRIKSSDVTAALTSFPPKKDSELIYNKLYQLVGAYDDPEIKYSEKLLGLVPYVTEVLMVVIRSKASTQFLENLKTVANISNKAGITPSHECVEIGFAIYLTPGLKMNTFRSTGIPQEGAIFYEHRGVDHPLTV